MERRLVAVGKVTLGAALVLLTIEIALVSILKYFTALQPPPEPVLANTFADPFLSVHVAAGVTALLLGPVQFVRRIRERRPALHRASGRIYVAACAVAAPSGFMLAIGTTAGPVAGVGFAIPALLWGIFTYLGVRAAIGRDFAQHRQWMIRSYAITFNAIMLRLMLPLSIMLGFEFLPAYRVISWLSWITSLALFELYLRRNNVPSRRRAALATA